MAVLSQVLEIPEALAGLTQHREVAADQVPSGQTDQAGQAEQEALELHRQSRDLPSLGREVAAAAVHPLVEQQDQEGQQRVELPLQHPTQQ